MKSEFLIVAKRLMEDECRAMSARELVDLGLKRQLFSDNVAGKTPHQTMKAKLSVHIRRHGDYSVFIRTAPGKFYLRLLVDGQQPTFKAKPTVPPKSTERVLVYRTEDLNHVTDSWQGLKIAWKRVSRVIFSRLRAQYIARFDVERNDDYTQILTYILVTQGDSLLSYRRGTYNRADQYLRGSLCVGFGGHVSELDLDLFSTNTMGIFRCASRELREELKLPRTDIERLRRGEGLAIVGIINDDSSDVGRRHLAFVMKYEVSSDNRWHAPERGEKAITQLRWISAKSSERVWLWNFEYWSQLCLRQFAPKLIRSGSTYRLLRKTPLKPPHLLCVIGPVGSGKTLATEVLKTDFGYVEINTGQVVAKLLGIPPVPQTPRGEFQEKAWDFISQPNGPKQLASEILRIANGLQSDRILVDGPRQEATIENLKKLSQDRKIGIVFVHTPADLAFSFFAERIAHGASMSEFLAARDAPVEKEVEGLISKADAVLYNWTGKLRYRDTIRDVMEDLGVSRSQMH